MRYLDVCAGISASTVAWKPLGWQAAAYSEIEAAPRAILAARHGAVPTGWDHRHTPGSNVTPLFGDFTQIEAHHVGPIDLLVGGTPCQDFSVAGLRKGLAGDRGNLTLEFLRLADRTRPQWLVWENVPGVLSIDAGRAFGAFLGGLGELGYGFAYRVLDAQHFGVPQRRRRVFVVGCLGDWHRAGAVLFERHSLSGHPAPRREAGSRSAVGALAGTSPGGGWRIGADEAAAGQLIAASVADTLPAGGNYTGGNRYPDTSAETAGSYLVAHSLRGEGFDASEDGTGRGTPLVPVAFSIMPMNSGKDYVARAVDVAQPLMAGGPVGGNQGGDFIVPFDTTQITSAANYSNPKPGDACHPLAAGADPPAIAFQERGRRGGRSLEVGGDVAFALTAPNGGGRGQERNVAAGSAVRRLTPRECERLQGFPDDFTLVPYRSGMMADGPRYKALGNSMAVPVMRWIGERIASVEAIAAGGSIAA